MYTRGAGVARERIALLQLATPGVCILLRLHTFAKADVHWPSALSELLEDPDVIKTGVGIGADLQLLLDQHGLPTTSVLELQALASREVCTLAPRRPHCLPQPASAHPCNPCGTPRLAIDEPPFTERPMGSRARAFMGVDCSDCAAKFSAPSSTSGRKCAAPTGRRWSFRKSS